MQAKALVAAATSSPTVSHTALRSGGTQVQPGSRERASGGAQGGCSQPPAAAAAAQGVGGPSAAPPPASTSNAAVPLGGPQHPPSKNHTPTTLAQWQEQGRAGSVSEAHCACLWWDWQCEDGDLVRNLAYGSRMYVLCCALPRRCCVIYGVMHGSLGCFGWIGIVNLQTCAAVNVQLSCRSTPICDCARFSRRLHPPKYVHVASRIVYVCSQLYAVHLLLRVHAARPDEQPADCGPGRNRP